MVLDNASTSIGSDAFQDSAPSSDSDPYSSSESDPQSIRYKVNGTDLPQPLPILGPLFGYDQALLSKVLHRKLEAAANSVKRPITQPEAEAFAYWTAKQISILSYGQFLGILAGASRCYGTAANFQFPFFKPNLEKLKTDSFPPVWPLLRGSRAIYAWHAVRFLAYGTAGNFFGQIVTGSYAMSVSSVGELTDKRLTEYVAAIRAEARKRQGGITQRVPGQPTHNTPQPRSSTGNQDIDDASPSADAWDQYDDQSISSGSEGAAQNTTPGAPRTSSWNPRTSSPAPPIQQDIPARDEQPFTIWDDASPTGGQGVSADTTIPQEQLQGSAWDRLRRGEKPTPRIPLPSNKRNAPPSQSVWPKQQNQTQQDPSERSTSGDSFTFSKTEEERALAQDEAQREFDARVERERRGGDFSKGNGDQKRW